jgi:hypothetical protein
MTELEQMLQQYLAAQLAKETPKPAEPVEAQKAFVTPEQLQAVLAGFATEVAKAVGTAVAEQVEKALPVREPGAGRAGTETPAEDPREKNPVAYLAAKAASDRTPEDKALAMAITKAVIMDGMRD